MIPLNSITFDPEKALEAILYVVGKVPHPTLHTISKLLYFADKEHLSANGALICGDQYVAMKHGPVPSEVYDMLKWARGDGRYNYGEEVRQAIAVHGRYTLEAKRPANLDYLSEAEIASLDASIAKHGNKEFETLTSESHDAAWDSAPPDEDIQLSEIIGTLSNSEEVMSYVFDRQTTELYSPEELA